MKWFSIVGIPVGAVLLAFVLMKLGPKPEVKPGEAMIPPVEYYTAESTSYQLKVRTQGVAQPAVEITLMPEVSGRITEVSEQFRTGSFFEKGELLLRLDPIQYEAALAEAVARLAAAELALAQELAAVEQAQLDWESLGRGEPTALALREPQQAQARADIEAARAGVAVARRNLERTEVKAPFAGRVREKSVDIGQIVSANTTQLAVLYGVDRMEVRLPLTMRETGLLDLPENYRGEVEDESGALVTFEADVGLDRQSWQGRIDRVEGTIDSRTRMVYAVAVVADPYRREISGDGGGSPLKAGLFLDAVIEGKTLEKAYVLPREVMVNENTLIVIDEKDQLHTQEVKVLHTNMQRVIITEGISDGARINRTPIEFFIEGMQVRAKPVE